MWQWSWLKFTENEVSLNSWMLYTKKMVPLFIILPLPFKIFFQSNNSKVHWKHTPRTFYLFAKLLSQECCCLWYSSHFKTFFWKWVGRLSPNHWNNILGKTKNKSTRCMSSALMEFQRLTTQFQDSRGCSLSQWRYVNKILKHWHTNYLHQDRTVHGS